MSSNGVGMNGEQQLRRALSDEPNASIPHTSSNKAQDGLERFAQAKADIRKAFGSIKAVLNGMQRNLQHWIVPSAQSDAEALKTQVAAALKKAEDLDHAVARDSMKVVFVGLTSAGKSTTINAVLRSRVLPSGFGQTTNRFINLYPTQDKTAKLIDQASNTRHELPALQELANALSDLHESDEAGDAEDTEISDPLNLYWPSSECEVLRNDLVILDSPGLRFTKKFDDWIDHTASDADVFVLVVNGEMALGREATEFFEQVRRKFSKPNVFLLFNRWELAPTGQRCDRSRKQLLGLARRLLVDTLGIVSPSQLDSRVFFVSSKETLERRVGEDVPPVKEADKKGLVGSHLTWENNPAARDKAFTTFEEEFALATSRHAIDTRFHTKVAEGTELVRQCEGIMRALVSSLEEHLQSRHADLKAAQDNLAHIQAKLPEVSERALAIAQTVPDQVQQYMHSKMNEILANSLFSIVDDFMSLSDFEDEESIELEKQELSTHVEACLQVELNDTCAPHVRDLYLKAFTDISALFKDLLPKNSPPERYVQMAFRGTMTLDCSHLPQSFKEDLTFHFSWGWDSLGAFIPDPIRMAAESFAADFFSRFTMSYKRAFRAPQGADSTANVAMDTTQRGEQRELTRQSSGLLNKLLRFAFDVGYICWDITTHTPYGLMVAATLPYAYRIIRRPWIRNVIGGSIFLYTATYAYEYMSFTTAAKEKLFRQQFAGHAQEKLKVAASSRARDAKESILLDLTETQQKLSDAVEQHKLQLQAAIADLKDSVGRTEEALNSAQTIKASVSENHLALVALQDKYFSAS